jgi:hypothetical protein
LLVLPHTFENADPHAHAWSDYTTHRDLACHKKCMLVYSSPPVDDQPEAKFDTQQHIKVLPQIDSF